MQALRQEAIAIRLIAIIGRFGSGQTSLSFDHLGPPLFMNLTFLLPPYSGWLCTCTGTPLPLQKKKGKRQNKKKNRQRWFMHLNTDTYKLSCHAHFQKEKGKKSTKISH
jgi:hypothetical protein